jgi:serine/threonine protein phosphatase PrpC
MALSFAARSDTGIRREDNEDAYCARPDLGLFAVADGLGGHAAGQVASRVAVEAIEAAVGRAVGLEEAARCGIDRPAEDAETRLRDACLLANHRIALLTADAEELHGMATTLAAVLVEPPDHGAGDRPAVIAHVGDSRIYRYSPGGLERLTADHSWVEEQVRVGLLTSSEARQHPWRNLVTRAISGARDLDVETRRVSVARGDRLLLCSDGLSSVVTDQEIGQVLAGAGDDGAACEMLIRAANAAGGPDNITVVLVTVE